MKRQISGNTRITVKDVARVAGVSLGTVSRVLNGADVGSDYARRVHDAVQSTGYRPNLIAGSLARKQKAPLQASSQATLQIGYFTNGLEDMEEEQQLHFLIGIERVVTASGRHLLYTAFKSDLETGRLPAVIREQKVDGAILKVGFNERGLNFAAAIAKIMPVVLMEAAPEDEFASAVLDDPVADIRKVVKHLKDLGHNKIACFSVRDVGGPLPNRLLNERVEAFRTARRSLGLPNDESLVFVPERNWGEESLDDVAGDIIARIQSMGSTAPTAVVCVTDVHAVALYQKAEAAGIQVPNQLSITGHGNMRRPDPHFGLLTTVTQPTLEAGRTAAELLLSQMDDPNMPIRQIRIAGTLIPRVSTAPPKPGG